MRLGKLVDGEEVAYCPAPTYVRLPSAQGAGRIVAEVAENQTRLVSRLVEVMPEPFYILYVLHTPRGEGAPGRYQSPPVTRQDVITFLARFAEFFQADGRFDMWIHSPGSKATVVWDRHNLLFAYGLQDAFEQEIRGFGAMETGEVPSMAATHVHHYRPECDVDAQAVLEQFEWRRSDLKPEDEQ